MLSGAHCANAAPSIRTAPLAGGHMPVNVRTSEVLPEPLGPMIAITSPAERLKLMLARIADVPSGGATAMPSTVSPRCGFGSAALAGPISTPTSPCFSLRRLSRRDKAAPVGDRGFNRRQRAGHHHRCGDHRAGHQL